MTVRNSYTYDNLLLLKDAGAVTANGAATVGGSARVLDVGDGRFEGVGVVDSSALDLVTGDETYRVDIQGSNVANMSSGVVTLGGVTVTAAGRGEAYFSNQQGATRYRYLRAFITVAGTTPSINCTVFIGKK